MGSVAAAHLVQFYAGAQSLAESLTSLFADSLMKGETVVVVAASDHREALDSALAGAGVNLNAEYRSGRLVPVDVEQSLAMFMTPTGPDPDLFRSTIGSTIELARRRTGSVNAYGELVGVLAERGDLPAALAVEALLDAMLQAHPFQLLCGYPREIVRDITPAFDSICTAHEAVVVSREASGPCLAATVDLPLGPNAAATARRAAHDVLSAWRDVDPPTLADAGLVVSELVAAAVRTTCARVSLALTLKDGQVLIAVTDAENRRPTRVTEADLTAAGRSFALLTSMTQAWGVESLPEGTRMWAKLPPRSA
ncbi:MAG TPA: MEDS domain-containing protein [Kineosporiaceae bacterium]|nr:MEDS domain-containing protein [Kineosporiaceae bacterium]